MGKVGIFREYIASMGGIETWLDNIADQFGKTHDLTIYYGSIDKQQKLMLSKRVKLVEYTGQDIRLDRAIFCYDFLGFKTVKAKKKIYMVHADYDHGYDLQWKPPGTVDEIYAVSKQAAKSASKLFGRDVEVMYNLLPVVEERPLKLISATRLSTEKGLSRMQELAKALDESGVNYQWDIYTSSYEIPPFGKNVVMKKPTLNIQPKIKAADLLVQLSDTESFGYSIVEAKMMGTGLVVTKLPVLPELFIDEDNAILVDFEGNNYGMTVEFMVKQSQYSPPRSDYYRLLGKPSRFKYEPIVIQNLYHYEMYVEQIDTWLEPKEYAVVTNKEIAKDILTDKNFKEL